MTRKTLRGGPPLFPKAQPSYLEEHRVPVPQVVANAYLGTKDAQTDGTLVTEFQDLTGLYKLEGSQIKLLLVMLGMLSWRVEREESSGRVRPVTEVRSHHADPRLKLPYIELKNMGSLVRAVTGTKKPSVLQYNAVEADILKLKECTIIWRHPLKDSGGEYLSGAVGLVISHEDESGKTIGLYFHPIVLETERFLTLPPTIFDEVKRKKGGTVLPDYYYRLIFLIALHGGRGEKPYNKRLPELIKELGLDRLEGRRLRRGKDAARKLLEEALAILSHEDIGLIGNYHIEDRKKVVRWETGPRGRGQGRSQVNELAGKKLLQIAAS